MSKVQLFISYSVKDKHLAGEIRRAIELDQRFSCFLAHDDIEPGSEWEQTIRNSLVAADCVLTIQTANFRQSFWCQQEVGMALQLGKAIVPLIPDGGVLPDGFLARYQAFTIAQAAFNDSIKNLLNSEVLAVQFNNAKQRINRFEELLTTGNAFQIKSKIAAERSKFIDKVENKFVLLKDTNSWQELWQAHLDVIHMADDVLILANQIISLKHDDAWIEFINLFSDLHNINEGQDRYGREGWVNHLFYTLLVAVGGIAIHHQYWAGIKKLFSLKKLNREKMEIILDWNIQAAYLEQKNDAGDPKWLVPRFKYVLDFIESKEFPIALKKFKESILDFDLLCFIYSVQFQSSGWLWYPCCMYYFNYRTPIYFNLINHDLEFRAEWSKKIFGKTADTLMTFLKEEALPAYNDLVNRAQGFTHGSPFKVLFEKQN